MACKSSQAQKTTSTELGHTIEVNASNTEHGCCTSSSSESLEILDKRLTVSILEGNVAATDYITDSFRYDYLAEDLQLCQSISLLQHVKS